MSLASESKLKRRLRCSEMVAEALPLWSLTLPSQRATIEGNALASAGVRYFDRSADATSVTAILTNDQHSVQIVIGAALTGARLISLPLPHTRSSPHDYVALVRSIMSQFDSTEVIVADEYAALLTGMGVRVREHSAISDHPLACPSEFGFELTQYTSGTTGKPRGVTLSDTSLGANLDALLHVIDPRPGDGCVSWLPLSHDMGLIGALICSVVAAAPNCANGAKLVLLDPATFLRDPSTWLRAMSDNRATFTAAPGFAYDLVAARSGATEVDLTAMRCAILGGEIVRSSTLVSVADALSPSGFRGIALSPAYGMAEVGVAATMTPPDVHWQEVARSDTSSTDLLEPTSSRRDGRVREGRQTRLVSSGLPLPGYRVWSTGGDTMGDIRLSGPSIGSDPSSGRSLAEASGDLVTGDVGFVNGGWLYACGRGDDYVVIRGRSVFAPGIEEEISASAPVRKGRVASVVTPFGEWVILAEVDQTHAPALSVVRSAVHVAAVKATGAPPDRVTLVAKGSLPVTSSGKLKRRMITSIAETYADLGGA